ncbi:MAG: hypothetical protein ACOX7N_01740 [Lawsonibacter sp.]
MANLMGVTNPVQGYDGPNNDRALSGVQKPNDTRVQNVSDPTRVGRADNRTDQKGAEDALASDVLRYDSNLQVFLQALRQAPDLGVELSRLIAWMRGSISTPGLSAGIAEELSAFLEMLRLDSAGFRTLFLNQMATGNRFSGPLLSLLRQAYQKIPNENVREEILTFLKRYSDFSSTEHVARNMAQILEQLPSYMPKSWRGQLIDLSARLQNSLQGGTREETLNLLEGEIVPYLASYVERTHDMGSSRGLIRLLFLNLTRYENGGEEGLLRAFRQLSSYGDILGGLNQLDDEALLKLLKENAFTQAVRQDNFSQQFAQLASRALRGECGTQAQEAFEEIVRAILIHESVFMPLRHGLLPVEWQGKMTYSEFWVDPDAQDRRSDGEREEDGTARFLFKMDIQNLGFLEFVLSARAEQVELNVYAPDAVAGQGSIVAEDLREILATHGLEGKAVRVLKGEKPLAITDVFPNLFEGKRSVNVKV